MKIEKSQPNPLDVSTWFLEIRTKLIANWKRSGMSLSFSHCLLLQLPRAFYLSFDHLTPRGHRHHRRCRSSLAAAAKRSHLHLLSRWRVLKPLFLPHGGIRTLFHHARAHKLTHAACMYLHCETRLKLGRNGVSFNRRLFVLCFYKLLEFENSVLEFVGNMSWSSWICNYRLLFFFCVD